MAWSKTWLTIGCFCAGLMLAPNTASAHDTDDPKNTDTRNIAKPFERAANRYLQRRRIGGNYRPPRRGFRPPDDIKRRLPHLRIDVRVTSIEATGNIPPAPAGDFFVRFFLTSPDVDSQTNATSEIPGPAQNMTVNVNRTVYSAVVLNGCSSETQVRLRGTSTVNTLTGGGDWGVIQLEDDIVGHGYYGMNYTFYDCGFNCNNPPDFNEPTWIVSGEVPAYCTAQTSPSPLN